MTNTENRAPEWYAGRIACLEEFMLPERSETLRRALAMRTRYMTLLAENTFHPQNAAALIRHCEAFGVQRILSGHVVLYKTFSQCWSPHVSRFCSVST